MLNKSPLVLLLFPLLLAGCHHHLPDLPETMMSGRAVNGYAVYCFYFFDGYHICKSVVSDGVRVLGLNVERNFFGRIERKGLAAFACTGYEYRF